MILRSLFNSTSSLLIAVTIFVFLPTTDALTAGRTKNFNINEAASRELPDFLLFDHDFEPLRKARLKGRWTLFFFGYLNCPDICPTTLQTLALIMAKLEQKNLRVLPQVVFVSVDPWRDTPDKLKQYVQYFHPKFIGASADAPQLNVLTNFFKAIYYNNRTQEQQQDYEVAHSDQIMLVNPDGEFEGFFKSPLNIELISEDLIKIIYQ